jgi:hypothetical protein
MILPLAISPVLGISIIGTARFITPKGCEWIFDDTRGFDAFCVGNCEGQPQFCSDDNGNNIAIIIACGGLFFMVLPIIYYFQRRTASDSRLFD